MTHAITAYHLCPKCDNDMFSAPEEGTLTCANCGHHDAIEKFRREVTTGRKQLPWTCPEHPTAQIRHSWDQNHYVLNGYPSGTGWQSGHRYECAECGRELASPRPSESTPA